jgi:baculoviral IAP repeat-containing protein 6
MEYTEAMLEVGQVASTNGFPSGHYFESKKLGGAGGRGGGALAKILMKEFKKMNKLLPSPHTDGGTIAVIFDEDNVQFARAVVTGRSGTPYFGGAFVFDVYFPDQYPQIPPLLQNKTTGNGTWRAHNNLYGDGKVCLSLLQNFSSNSSEKWDPDHSSLYQVLMGIQSQILCEEPYYAAGRGKTPATALRSRAENHDIRVKTMHHAMVAMVRERRRFGPEVAEVIYAHFVALEWRLVVYLRRCLAEAEAEQSPRSTAMMHRVIVETRTWFRKLRAGHAGEGQQQELNSDDRSAEDEVNLVAEARGAALSDTHISDDLRDWKKRSETHKAEPAAQETSLNGSQRSAALGEAAREAREAGPSKHATSSGILAPAGAADKDGNAPHLKRRAAAHKPAQRLAVDESERKSALEAAACDARAERAAKYQRLEQRGGRDGLGGSHWWLAALALVAVAAAAIAIAVPALQ